MNRISETYKKYQNFIENILFPVLLVLYPIMMINQGIDVSDTTYSLANFQYFNSMDGTWIVATFLSNVVGNLMMRFPFGSTMMGMYFYTALVQSVTAFMVYAALRRRIPAPFVFVGEWIALGLCWCPSTVLYNYLTYLLMAAGILLLHHGILKDDKKYYVAAGICLGMNVAVRMPNVVQTAMIIAVWYAAVIYGRTWQQAIRETLWCVLGYAIGFGIPLTAICIRYGVSAYPAMVKALFAMTDKATDYKPAAMVTGMLGDYRMGLYRLVFAGICMAGGWALFALQRRLFAGRHSVMVLCKSIYIAVLFVLLRFYWGRGVFTFFYYEDSSIYNSAVLLLLAAILAALYCLFNKHICPQLKILAILLLVQVFVTPLGSNNYLYPIINNMFIAVPFLLWVAYDRYMSYREKDVRGEAGIISGTGTFAFVWGAPLVLLTALLFVQSTGFHMAFAFRDGIEGEVRDTKLTMPVKTEGIYTNRDNAAWLQELAEYAESANLTERELISYGEIPGLGYLLDMPPALSTFWPDLPSYLMSEYERDMEQLAIPPVIIAASPIAAYLNEDADGMNWFGADREALDADEKLQILAGYMRDHSYRETFGNGRYVVYLAEE
ncbi:MAG: hypothetical protein J1F18_02200 [Lachnospiraceae bacterium]|nr:hypothetical protein [Lachnospiraceae bacterium]